ncbi:RlpA-like double-psi beta-barrel-protein domain-containing protein-containing protein [Abortiporus biennis]|nr:RlpA-like double-psi beta-barrel-protein domain-containing protein-containing protein [Abortiporus biennis]
MVRLSALLVVIPTLLASTFATPVPVSTNGTEFELLEKRVTHTGRGTFYYTGLGACGWTNHDSEAVIAISSSIFGKGGNCGQYVQITNTKNKKTTFAKTVDSCPGCGSGDLDMSPSTFQKLGTLDQGVLSISWHFQAKGWKP